MTWRSLNVLLLYDKVNRMYSRYRGFVKDIGHNDNNVLHDIKMYLVATYHE